MPQAPTTVPINKLRSKLPLLVLTNSREQSIDVYRQIKEMDREGDLKISRLGSISIVCPHLMPGEEARGARFPAELTNFYNEVSLTNLAQVAEDPALDILIAAPWQLTALSAWSRVYRAETVILEDFELLFEEQTISAPLERVLNTLHINAKYVWASRCPTPPIPNSSLQRFPQLESLKFVQKEEVEIENYHTEEYKKNEEMAAIWRVIQMYPNQRGVVFCSSEEHVLEVNDYLTKQQKVRTYTYCQSIMSPSLHWNYTRFRFGPPRVLVCNERKILEVEVPEADFAIWVRPAKNNHVAYYRHRTVSPTTQTHELVERNPRRN